MRVKEMIKELEHQREWGDACLSDIDAIIDAINVGQVMANHLDKCINQHNPPKINYEDTLPVLIAWDEATKGEA